MRFGNGRHLRNRNHSGTFLGGSIAPQAGLCEPAFFQMPKGAEALRSHWRFVVDFPIARYAELPFLLAVSLAMA
jgi:hypothetical protein